MEKHELMILLAFFVLAGILTIISIPIIIKAYEDVLPSKIADILNTKASGNLSSANTYDLTFEDENGAPVDGNVYSNQTFLGETKNGKITLSNFTAGMLTFVYEKNQKNFTSFYPLAKKDIKITIRVQFLKEFEGNPFEDENAKYMNALELENPELRLEAINASRNCASGDRECQLVSIYDHVKFDYKYFADSRKKEVIQTPSETKIYGGGDAEDLTIMLSSLLENIGIETYMVFTKNYTYLLACDVNPDIVHNYTVDSFKVTMRVRNISQIVEIPEFTSWYYGPDTLILSKGFDKTDPAVFRFNLISSKELALFALPNESEFQKYDNGENYSMVNGTYYDRIKNLETAFFIPYGGYVFFLNPSYGKATANISIIEIASHYLVPPEEIRTFSYRVDRKVCIPLDPSAGEIGYAGLELIKEKDKVFINSVTKENGVLQ